MAVTIFWSLLAISLIIGVNAEGQFAVLHAPPSVAFVGGNRIPDTVLKHIYLVALGFTPDKTSSWSEMKLVNPFDTPEAAVVFYVVGVNSIGTFGDDSKLYILSSDSLVFEAYEEVVDRIAKLEDLKCKVVDMRLSDEHDLLMYNYVFGPLTNYKVSKLPLSALTYDMEVDYYFVREIQALKAVISAVKNGAIKTDGVVDFYQFSFTSLHSIIGYYGANSSQAIEAKNILNQQIRELNNAFVEAYSGNVLFTVVMSDNITAMRERRSQRMGVFRNWLFSTVPRRRRTPTSTTTSTTTETPEAMGKYSVHDIAIINIIFWLCTTLYLTMIAIVFTIATMDPGRDSIVYRMTSSIDRVKME